MNIRLKKIRFNVQTYFSKNKVMLQMQLIMFKFVIHFKVQLQIFSIDTSIFFKIDGSTRG